MLAYHNDESIKAKYIARVRMHRAADALIQGQGWEDGKGCAVGCTLEAYDHKRYPIELGVPMQLAYLEDRLFELSTAPDARLWPEQFLDAIPVGADLSRVWPQWAEWMLVSVDWGVIRYANTDAARSAIERVAELYRIGGTPEQFREARFAAYAAAAYAYAAEAADAAYADAAYAAAYADAAYADAAYAAAYAAAAAARDDWVVAARAKLLELLAAAPVGLTDE